MCGRYHLSTPTDALATIFGFVDLPNLAARWNIAPTQSAPIIQLGGAAGSNAAGDGGQARRLYMARWGLTPPWATRPGEGPPLINARGETIARKPAFRHAFRTSRCLALADGFYEWTGKGAEKRAFCIRPRNRQPFAFAAISALMPQPEPGIEARRAGDGRSRCFSIVTTAANAVLAPIHHRMPVVIPMAAASIWLSGAPMEAEALLRPADDDFFEVYEVDRRVGNVREDDVGLINAVAAAIAMAKPADSVAGADASAEAPAEIPDQMTLF